MTDARHAVSHFLLTGYEANHHSNGFVAGRDFHTPYTSHLTLYPQSPESSANWNNQQTNL